MSGPRSSGWWSEVERLFHEAEAIPPDERDAFLERACRGDHLLRTDVESLLRYAASAGPFIESPAAHVARALAERAGGAASAHGWIGRVVGPYRIAARIGAGGMGEVYRAHDSRLGRACAIKVLPATFAGDADRLRRFQREARLLASLSHPNIGGIHGLEESEAGPVLVLELVEGPTLADTLAGGPLRTGDALGIAVQIAEGLEAAHEKGIVHRDLKPANVKVSPSGVVKILDFGIAKALAGDDGAAPGAGETHDGAIVGTPAYMSPEQARAQPVDKRSDIWAFGCVLFEMLTGRPPFGGETGSDAIAAVLERQPDWTLLPRQTPAGTRRLLVRCLEKDPRRRLRDIGDARHELEAGAEPELPVRRDGWRWWAAVAVTTIVLTAGAALLLRPSGENAAPISFVLMAPDGQRLASTPIPSPDGKQLAFAVSSPGGEPALWVRSLESPVPRRLAGTEGASRAFWSADGAFVGFDANGFLKRIAVEGGPVQTIAPTTPLAFGAASNGNGDVVFTPSNRLPLFRVAPGAPDPVALTALDADRLENSHRWPSFLPEGRRFLFTARSERPEYTGVYVGSLDGGTPRWLFSSQSQAVYVDPGYLLFVRDGTLLAHRFDAATLELSGAPIAVAGDVVQDRAASSAWFSASANGDVLAYRAASPSIRVSWFDRAGRELSSLTSGLQLGQMRLAPDGARAAFSAQDAETGNWDVWVMDLASGAANRITAHPASDWFPVWSPDGRDVLYGSDRNETPSFYRAPADGSGREQLVFRAESAVDVFPTDWTARGIAFHSYPRGDIGLLRPPSFEASLTLVESPYTDWTATVSPSAPVIAYVSDETGSEEVYVRSLDGASKLRVSVGGGSHPRWRADGRELFFLTPDNRLMASRLEAEPLAAAPPQALFRGCGERPQSYFYRYDVAADGARVLMQCVTGANDAPTTIAVHWRVLLDR